MLFSFFLPKSKHASSMVIMNFYEYSKVSSLNLVWVLRYETEEEEKGQQQVEDAELRKGIFMTLT